MKTMRLHVDAVREVLGNRQYEKIKEFFYQFLIAKSETKLLLTRRSYVLYKFFRMIIEEEEKENPDFEQVGKVYNTHSMCDILMGEEAQGVLVCDDIIVNGRTMKHVLQTLCDKHNIEKADISIWCMQCNEEAAFLEDFEENICHARYVKPYQWQEFSDVLTDCITAANIGYVSLVDSYRICSKAESQVLASVSHCYHKRIESKTKPGNEELRIECYYFMDRFPEMNLWESYSVKPLLRFYRGCGSLLIIPMVFLPAMPLVDVSDYCRSVLAAFHRPMPDLTGIEVTPDRLVQLYKWTIRELGNYLVEKYLESLALNVDDSSEKFLDCSESFWLKSIRMETGTPVSGNYGASVPETAEMQECREWFCEALQNAGTDEGVCKYLARVRREDDERAHNGRERIFGLSFADAYRLLQGSFPDGALGEGETERSTKAIADIILNCDVGAFAYVVDAYTVNGTAYISGLLRHGEQAMRALFTAYRDVYGILYNFFRYTHDVRSSEVKKFVDYYDSQRGVARLRELERQLCYGTLFADIMTITPESVGGQEAQEASDSVVAEYHREYYGKKSR